mgnify:CR=1 FL=1
MSTTLAPQPSQTGREDFVAAYGEIYEHSPWVAAAAWDRGLSAAQDTPEGLAQAMAAVLNAASEADQLQVLRAHPDLAGKAAVAGELTEDSSREQAGAGLDRLTEEEFQRFQTLNDAYRQKFDFPFILAVRGHDKHSILRAFEERLENTPEQERRTAIEQVNRIALLRLKDRASS